MSENTRSISIQLLDKNYHVDCPTEQIASLQEAALYLDDRLQECTQHMQKPSQLRQILMTALNLSHELIISKQQSQDYVKTMGERIKHLQHKIDTTITKQHEMDLGG